MEIGVCLKDDLSDPRSKELLHAMRSWFSAPIDRLTVIRVYSIPKLLSKEHIERLHSVFADPISESGFLIQDLPFSYDWAVEIKLKEGLTDNAGATAKTVIEESLGLLFSKHEQVCSSTLYLFKGAMREEELRRIASELLANELIEEIRIKKANIDVVEIDLPDQELLALSKKRHLALNLEEMRAIKAYFASEEAKALRSAYELPHCPTDVELEAIAQTWSEHCKHKIFNAKIDYEGKTIDSLYKSYVKKATDPSLDWLISVFTDNAGIIALNDDWHLAVKVETHNSPSAIDPYGGALTGILGVNRDILGAGKGAKLIANMDVFCFAPPNYAEPLPPRLLHPKRIFEGVRRGVEHGGNKSGVPTVNGAIVFDERYLGKPLVYCGSIGLMSASDADDPKRIEPNDLIVIAGGRTGKDGIHGATFSSEELHEKSPTGAVQLGDPYTQKKLHDFLLDAKKENLFRSITDNGAGGFSSSIGEMAQLSNGCEIHLEKAPLKYPGLLPWEILLSESQERMTLAVDPKHFERLFEIARLHEVEICSIGTFTATGLFHVLYEKKTAALLPLIFLHDGVPQMHLEAKWIPPKEIPCSLPHSNLGTDLHQLLSRYNICSKESVIRQYDHEVQGASALKPLVGPLHDGPGDAAILRPLEIVDTQEGIVISNGLCPRYSDIDAYWMSACAIDEAIRNQICVGADPKRIAILDNFCWPDPLADPHLLAQLVRSSEALYRFATAFKVPIISGKDSMKNDYRIGGKKISIPPTLLITAVGKIQNVLQAISMDVKHPDDLIYLVGQTKNELGASEWAAMKGISGGIVPKVDAASALSSFLAIHRAIEKELIASCHDCSDGGLAVALAESAFAGGLGMNIDLPLEGLALEEMLFSESPSRFVITIAPENRKAFEETLQGCHLTYLGTVTQDPVLQIKDHLKEDIFALKASWQRTLP